MELNKAKSAADVKLEGLLVEFERHDGNLKAVLLTDASGRRVKIAVDSYYSMDVLIPSPPKKVTKFRLTGEVLGMKLEELYETKPPAQRRRIELAEALSIDDDEARDALFPIEEVEVEEAQ